MLKKLLLLSFIEGAAVMAAELCGAKLLAPIFGSSLYVWASVMGITLAALAGGYFAGGIFSTRWKDQSKVLFHILGTASLFILLMPVLSYYLIPRLSYFSFNLGIVSSTFCLLFPPVFFLGASSPFFISLQTSDISDAGRVGGFVYAISTAGGILSTFLCGFYLIPVLGLTMCLVCFGSILFIVDFMVMRRFSGVMVFLFVVLGYLNFQILFQKGKQLFTSDSILGKLEVVDHYNGKDSTRILVINGIIQTEMNVRTKLSSSDYITILTTLTPKGEGKQALVLGLGGGLVSNMLVLKKYTTDGVEFDERISHCADKYFFLDEKVNVHNTDARIFLNHCDKKYNVIIVDLFKAEEQPSHILTMESLKALKRNLYDSSLILINWHGYLQGVHGAGTRILYNTLIKSGYHVRMCAKNNNETGRNLIFVVSQHKLASIPFEISEDVAATEIVNTDDQPLMEMYNARANKAWRTQYLRYYQGMEQTSN